MVMGMVIGSHSGGEDDGGGSHGDDHLSALLSTNCICLPFSIFLPPPFSISLSPSPRSEHGVSPGGSVGDGGPGCVSAGSAHRPGCSLP